MSASPGDSASVCAAETAGRHPVPVILGSPRLPCADQAPCSPRVEGEWPAKQRQARNP